MLLHAYVPAFLAFVCFGSTIACGCEPKSSSPKSQTTPAHANASTTRPGQAQRVATHLLTPTTYEIRTESLPKPYATESASKSPQVIAPPDARVFHAPKGFEVSIFAANLEAPRWLHKLDDGSVLVTETRERRITRLVDSDGNGVVDRIDVFATEENGLAIPFGMAHTATNFYVGNDQEVLQFPFTKDQTRLSGRGKRLVELPGGGYRQHWTRNVVLSPTGDELFVSIGSASNAEVEPLPRASVQRVSLSDNQMVTYASGLRNPVGMAFHPATHELYVTVNERDALGDDLVPDFFTRVQEGAFFGWPYAYLSPTLLDPRHVRDGKSVAPDKVAKTQSPDVLFQAHSAALGLTFYDPRNVQGDSLFPERYHHGAFVAFRGSWNRSAGTGYKIVFIPFGADARPQGTYEDFVKGFLTDPQGPTTWGRPVGLLQLDDGSLLFTEEANGFVYRVRFRSS